MLDKKSWLANSIPVHPDGVEVRASCCCFALVYGAVIREGLLLYFHFIIIKVMLNVRLFPPPPWPLTLLHKALSKMQASNFHCMLSCSSLHRNPLLKRGTELIKQKRFEHYQT